MPENNAESILIVDDDQEFLGYLRAVLRPLGCEIVAASTGGEACRAIAARRFSMVLADLRLPDLSGLDVLESARKTDPIAVGVVLTAHGSLDSALEALREGAYDYLVKPLHPATLLAAVRRGLEHWRLKRALVQKTAQLENLQHALDAKTQLIQNASHELKNPLTVVYGYSSFLLRNDAGDHDPGELRKNLESINRNAERLSVLLDELIESTRLSQHKIELRRERASAASLAREAFESHRCEAARKDLDLRLEAAPGEDLWILADECRVHQILSNLVGNALKFTPEGGAITLAVDKDGAFARFCVRDTGAGISPEGMSHLFERFYQEESSRRHNKGLGLGLNICKSLAELHGGSIWAESAPGAGSAFFFTIPLAHDAVLPPSQPRAATAHPSGGTS
ncbi:MAG: hybrid sensor histidine kinase/response regulator [Elusimicrobia bacterium]|nr:hybrid sensor histidine kinase/response regulator [Elusimicrobiota bacterium]